MYYKVMKNSKPIDALQDLIFVKYQPKHKIYLLSSPAEAQGVLSSDGVYAYHDNTFERCDEMVQVDEIVEIEKYEYDQLQYLQMRTYDEVVDAIVLSMIERDLL